MLMTILRSRTRCRMGRQGLSCPAGGGLAEVVISLPVVLILGLGLLQLFLIILRASLFQYSVSASARAIAASDLGTGVAGIELVLSQQMAPSFVRLKDLDGGLPHFLSPPQAMKRYAVDRSLGYLSWDVVSPFKDSFYDWSAGSVDRLVPITAGEGSDLRQPRSGSVGRVNSLPIGRLSGQSLLDASTLKIRVRMGMPLEIPLVGRLIAEGLSWAKGCPVSNPKGRLGALDLGRPTLPLGGLSPVSFECAMLIRSLNEGRPRIPISAVGMALLQHPVRESALGL